VSWSQVWLSTSRLLSHLEITFLVTRNCCLTQVGVKPLGLAGFHLLQNPLFYATRGIKYQSLGLLPKCVSEWDGQAYRWLLNRRGRTEELWHIYCCTKCNQHPPSRSLSCWSVDPCENHMIHESWAQSYQSHLDTNTFNQQAAPRGSSQCRKRVPHMQKGWSLVKQMLHQAQSGCYPV
jgi:hypothetical protein